jgi:glucose/arabinose dehydrogenase
VTKAFISLCTAYPQGGIARHGILRPVIRRIAACAAAAATVLTVAATTAHAPPHRETADPAVVAAGSPVRLDKIGTFTNPVYIAGAPEDSDRVFVVERPGQIKIVRNGKKNSRPFLDIRSRVRCCGEQGLLSMAFAPDYPESRKFYVFFTERPSGDLRVFEYRAREDDADRADPSTARALVRVGHRSRSNHNGGQLQIGPDGMLYISTGDGGGAGDPGRNGQNRRSRLGKILRIDPEKGGTPEVYSYGLRNPFRFSFDRSTGDLTIGDVGQDAVEEINFARRGKGKGANFGWSVFEGTRRYRSGSAPGHRKPSIQHSHSAGWCSIIGGYVVRDRSLSGVFGRYVYGDFCKGQLYYAQLKTGRATSVRPLGVSVGSLSSFGEDTEGRIYAASLSGSVYRLRAR